MTSTPFDILLGEQLSAVSFVQDYVEFHFDGPVLRALNNPIATTPDGTFQFPARGSRDALCAAIAHDVTAVEYRPGVAIEIRLAGGFGLTVPLDDASYQGPEAAHFMVDQQFVLIE